MESEGSEYVRERGERADRQRMGQKSVSRRENSSVQSEDYCKLRGMRAGCTQQWYWTRIPLPDQACSATGWCRLLNITKIYMVSFVGQAWLYLRIVEEFASEAPWFRRIAARDARKKEYGLDLPICSCLVKIYSYAFFTNYFDERFEHPIVTLFIPTWCFSIERIFFLIRNSYNNNHR